jgi:hypothetical protein
MAVKHTCFMQLLLLWVGVQVAVEMPAGREMRPVALRVEQWGVTGPHGLRACQAQAEQVQEQIRKVQARGVAEPQVMVQGKLTQTEGE